MLWKKKISEEEWGTATKRKKVDVYTKEDKKK